MPAVSVSGYHRLLIDDREIVLAVAPRRCHTIDDAVPDARLWGIAAQVYSLRHRGDGGIGDASGIAALADAAGSRGADALALSPMHALFGADPSCFGPYSPSTRLFLNPLHASAALVFGEAHVADIVARRRAGRDVRTVGGAAAHRLASGRARQASSAAGAVRAIHRRRWPAAAGLRKLPRRWRRVARAACGVRDAACGQHARTVSAIGTAGRRTCAIRAAPPSRCSRHPTSARCCSTASCSGWPIARSPSRSAARGPPACASA